MKICPHLERPPRRRRQKIFRVHRMIGGVGGVGDLAAKMAGTLENDGIGDGIGPHANTINPRGYLAVAFDSNPR